MANLISLAISAQSEDDGLDDFIALQKNSKRATMKEKPSPPRSPTNTPPTLARESSFTPEPFFESSPEHAPPPLLIIQLNEIIDTGEGRWKNNIKEHHTSVQREGEREMSKVLPFLLPPAIFKSVQDT